MGRTTRTTTGPTKAVGSIRVSTGTQADHGISLDAQQAKRTASAQLSVLELGRGAGGGWRWCHDAGAAWLLGGSARLERRGTTMGVGHWE